jgi:uncharacterized C2H2 Zn-finger protein
MKLLENNWGKIRCPYCDSVMEIEKDDIMDNCDGEIFITCPVCDSYIWLTHNPVAQKIKDGITWHK